MNGREFDTQGRRAPEERHEFLHGSLQSIVSTRLSAPTVFYDQTSLTQTEHEFGRGRVPRVAFLPDSDASFCNGPMLA